MRLRILLFALIGLLSACGGGGGGGATDQTPVVTAPSPVKATVSISITNAAALPYPINYLQMSGSLPAGLTVTTGDTSDPTRITSGLLSGSALAATQSLTFYGYLLSSKIIITCLSSAVTGFGTGEIAQLVFTLPAGTTISEATGTEIENSITITSALSYPDSDNGKPNPIPLSIYLKPAVSVTLAN
jgi:hypothetical protein